jgi:hypothetical protein
MYLWLTNSTEPSPFSEAIGGLRSAGQEIHRRLWNPKVQYRLHNRPPSVHTLSQMKPFHTLQHYLLKLHFDILPSTTRSSKLSLPFRLSNQYFASISHLPMRATCPVHFILLDLIAYGWTSEFCTIKTRLPVIYSTLSKTITSYKISTGVRISTELLA